MKIPGYFSELSSGKYTAQFKNFTTAHMHWHMYGFQWHFCHILSFPNTVSFDDFTTADDDVLVTEELSDREIVTQVLDKHGIRSAVTTEEAATEATECDNDDTGVELVPPTSKDAASALEALRTFFPNSRWRWEDCQFHHFSGATDVSACSGLKKAEENHWLLLIHDTLWVCSNTA